MLLLQEVEKGEEDIVEVSMSNASLIVSETKASAACMHRHAIWLWLAAHKAGLPALAGLAGAALGTQSKACFADMPLGAAGTSTLHLSSCGSCTSNLVVRQSPFGAHTVQQCRMWLSWLCCCR